MDRQQQPSEVERILAFDAATGRPLWKHEYPVTYGNLDYGNGPRAAPTIHDGRVYTLGAVGHVTCLDVTSGKLLWSHDCVGEMQAKVPVWGLAASPVIWHDLAIIHAGGAGRVVYRFRSQDRQRGVAFLRRFSGLRHAHYRRAWLRSAACRMDAGKRRWHGARIGARPVDDSVQGHLRRLDRHAHRARRFALCDRILGRVRN